MTTDWYDPTVPTMEQMVARLTVRMGAMDDALIQLHSTAASFGEALRTLAARCDKAERDLGALRSEMMSRTDPRLFSGQ